MCDNNKRKMVVALVFDGDQVVMDARKGGNSHTANKRAMEVLRAGGVGLDDIWAMPHEHGPEAEAEVTHHHHEHA